MTRIRRSGSAATRQAARQRVALYGDGWCPFPAPPQLAQTAGTAAIDSVQRLADGIDDLRRRCDAAGRDWSAIDITFTNFDGGSLTDDDFNADAYLDGLEKLAKLGRDVGRASTCPATAWRTRWKPSSVSAPS